MRELRVLNLNFWGLYIISKNRQERLKALVDVLLSPDSDWDFVALEEVWSERDYCFLTESVREVYPHSYYFYSGVVGSGVCVLSKGQIVSVLTHVYSLNGHAHKLQHGDWFAGKVVGLCKIVYRGLRINLYATHVHAEYNRKSDEYLAHRITQAYELSQFVKLTSAATDDVNILAGDFNFEPDDLGYAIIRRFADLRDAWVTRLDQTGSDDGNTCNTPDNVYSTLENKGDKEPRGKRIDFIMYGGIGGRSSVFCTSCRTVLNKIPCSGLCYSDHKGLEAVLQVGSSETVFPDVFSPPVGNTVIPTFLNTFDSAQAILDLGLRRASQNRQFFLVILVVAFALLLGTVDIDQEMAVIFRWLINGIRALLVIVISGCFWMVGVSHRVEYHALLAAKNAMAIQRKWEDLHGARGKPEATTPTHVADSDSKSRKT